MTVLVDLLTALVLAVVVLGAAVVAAVVVLAGSEIRAHARAEVERAVVRQRATRGVDSHAVTINVTMVHHHYGAGRELPSSSAPARAVIPATAREVRELPR